jgi:hypothetical protein
MTEYPGEWYSQPTCGIRLSVRGQNEENGEGKYGGRTDGPVWGCRHSLHGASP